MQKCYDMHFLVSNIFMNSLDAIIEKISREKKIVTNIDNLLVFCTSRKTPLYASSVLFFKFLKVMMALT